MRILTINGYIDAVALFFELSDEQLDRVSKNKNCFNDVEFTQSCLEAHGENAHFYHLCNNRDESIIYQHLALLKKQYKTISWWDKQMETFQIIRSPIWQYQP